MSLRCESNIDNLDIQGGNIFQHKCVFWKALSHANFVSNPNTRENFWKNMEFIELNFGVTRGAPWTRTKLAWRSSTQCMGLRLCNICAWVNGPKIGEKGFFVLQVWYNSISTTCHVARGKSEKLFKTLGTVLIVKLSKEARGYNWCPFFFECWTLGNTVCISNNTISDSCCIGCPLKIC
jgi:hypothetical protein